MSEALFKGAMITGVAAAVPEQFRTIKDDMKIFGEHEVLKVSESTGVKKRHISTTLCTSDLCFESAKRLMAESDCMPGEIDAVVFISQSPDYTLPATACILQHRLNLSKACAAFDINLGCSGYAYGLWVISAMIASGAIKKALLLVGDMSFVYCSPKDRSVALLFGDAGTATLIEYDTNASASYYVLGTDGSGKDCLAIPDGGGRNKATPDSFELIEYEGGNKRSAMDIYMNGAEIFAFTLKTVPTLIEKILLGSGQHIDKIDYFVFHQANKFMLEHLRKRIKIPPGKFVLGLQEYGNTSSASIPLAMVTELREKLIHERLKLVLAGFGVGFSWSGVSVCCDKIVVPELIKVPELR